MSSLVPVATKSSCYTPKKNELMASITGVLNNNTSLQKNASVRDIQQAIEKENPNWKVSEKKVKKYIKKNNLADLKDDDIPTDKHSDDVSVASSIVSSASQRLKSVVTSPLKLGKKTLLRRKSKQLPPIDSNVEVQFVQKFPPAAEQAPMRTIYDDENETEKEENVLALGSPVGRDQGTSDTAPAPSFEDNVEQSNEPSSAKDNVDGNTDDTQADVKENEGIADDSPEQKEREIDTGDVDGGENKVISVAEDQGTTDTVQAPLSKDNDEQENKPESAEDNMDESAGGNTEVNTNDISKNDVVEKSSQETNVKDRRKNDFYDGMSVASSIASSASQSLKSIVKNPSSLKLGKKSLLRKNKKHSPTNDANVEVQSVEKTAQVDRAPLLPTHDENETETETKENVLGSPVGEEQETTVDTQAPPLKDNIEEEEKKNGAKASLEKSAEDKIEETKDETADRLFEERSSKQAGLKEDVGTIDDSLGCKEHEPYTGDVDGEDKEMICAGCIIL